MCIRLVDIDFKVCDIFELENMRILHLKHSNLKATLSFEYRCHSCKQIFPLKMLVASSCGELLNSDVIYKVQKVRDEETTFIDGSSLGNPGKVRGLGAGFLCF